DLHPFLVTPAAAFGVPVCRLGLASYGQTAITPDDVLYALGRGVTFLNWQGLAEGPSGGDALTAAGAPLGGAPASGVVCAQFGARAAGDGGGGVRVGLAVVGTGFGDRLAPFLGGGAEGVEGGGGPGGALGYLRDAKRDGVVRRIGVTSHQRPLAAQM